MNKLVQKTQGVVYRMQQAVILLPDRIMRWVNHLSAGVLSLGRGPGKRSALSGYYLWWIELVFYSMDVLGLPELYESLSDFVKWNTRPLNGPELVLARSVFRDSIDYPRVRIDEGARVACKRHQLFYVSFYTVNGWGPMQQSLFIHELMHVWQFQRMGSVYIPRALLAQRTRAGYDYGGVESLLRAMQKDEGFANFNLEQQADIIADYFCLREGLIPRWCDSGEGEVLPLYEYFVHQLKNEK